MTKMRAFYPHSCVLQPVSVVPEHMLRQHHARGPKLASASRLQVLVELEWLAQETCEVYFRGARGLVFREGGDVLAESKRQEFRRYRSLLLAHFVKWSFNRRVVGFLEGMKFSQVGLDAPATSGPPPTRMIPPPHLS